MHPSSGWMCVGWLICVYIALYYSEKEWRGEMKWRSVPHLGLYGQSTRQLLRCPLAADAPEPSTI
jgi:hypothetical protein